MQKTAAKGRKRANINAAAGNLRMIHRLVRDADYGVEFDVHDLILIRRLAAAALRDLGHASVGARDTLNLVEGASQ